MVEIEEVPEAKPPTTTDADGWQTLMGDDMVMKLVDKSPLPREKEPEAINPQDTVLVDFTGRVADDKHSEGGTIFQEVKGWLVVVGDGDVLPCLEMAIRFMETGQTSQVWSNSKYAFGNGTRSYLDDGGDKCQLPPHTNVMFEVKVTMIVMDTSRLNPYFTIQKAVSRKSIANDIYQYEWCAAPHSPEDPSCDTAMSRAIRLYTKAAKDMETLSQGTYFQQVEVDHPQRLQTQQVLLDCLNNITAVQLRQHQYHKAKQSAIEVLKQDPKNIKALLRAAKSSLLDTASTMEEVEAALHVAEAEITYKNPQEEKQLKQIKAQFKKKRHEYKERTKAMFGDKLKNNALSGDDTAEARVASSASDQSAGDESKEAEKAKADGETETEIEMAKDEASFWKTQFFTIFLQVILPLGLYFLYRLVQGADQVGEATLAANEARMPQVEDVEEIIDLD